MVQFEKTPLSTLGPASRIKVDVKVIEMLIKSTFDSNFVNKDFFSILLIRLKDGNINKSNKTKENNEKKQIQS